MNRNIAKQFTTTLSLLDVASDRTHKYKCFHGEDIQLTVNVVGEENRRIDLSNTSVKIYFTLDKNVNEPIYRQDTGIVVDNLGVITVMLEKSYIRIGNNVLKIVLYDEDQTVFLQPLIISCIDPSIGEEADLEIPADINVRDEIYDIRRIIGDLQDFDDDLGSEIVQARGANLNLKERLDNVDSRLDNTEREKTCYSARSLGFKFDGSDETDVLKYALNFKDNISIIFPNNKTIIITEPIVSISNNLEIIGNGTWVKVKDNCGILERMSNREFMNHHEMGIISAYGDNFKCSNLNVDVNCFNNSFTDENGGKWYHFSTNHGDTTLPSNKRQSGFTAIHTYGHNAIIEYCNIKNGSWGGISCGSRYGESAKAKNCIIRYNLIETCVQDAIDFILTDGIEVYGNIIKNPYYHSIHSYNSNFNTKVYNNEIIHTTDFEFKKITPNANPTVLPVALNISHSKYPHCESRNIKFYNNDVRNYSSIPTSYCIHLQYLSFTRDVDITNNYIYNYTVGIVTDVYNYGDINIRDNKIECSDKPIFIRLDPQSYTDTGLPTFTSEIPNSKINISSNTFINCNKTLISEGNKNNADKHTKYCTSCVINEINNKHLDKKTDIFKLHSNAFANVSLSQPRKKKAITPLNDWILTIGMNYRNDILVEYDKNEIKVNFDLSNGTQTDLFYIESNGLNQVFTYPAMARVNGVWKPTVVQVKEDGKVDNRYLESGTSRIIGSFIYPLI